METDALSKKGCCFFLLPKQADSQLFIHSPNFKAWKSHNVLRQQILVFYKTNTTLRTVKRHIKSTNAQVKVILAQGLTCLCKALILSWSTRYHCFGKTAKICWFTKTLSTARILTCRGPDNSDLKIFNVLSESYTSINYYTLFSQFTIFFIALSTIFLSELWSFMNKYQNWSNTSVIEKTFFLGSFSIGNSDWHEIYTFYHLIRKIATFFSTCFYFQI